MKKLKGANAKPAGALVDYTKTVFRRDRFRCVYCGFDGSKWPKCMFLQGDHLLPKGNSRRNDREFIVCACSSCNVLDNKYFKKARELGISFKGKSRSALIKQRKSFVEGRRKTYQEWFKANRR